MKINTLLFGIALSVFAVSCGESKVETTEPQPAATQEQPANPAPAATPAAEPENSTEIKVSNNGGEIETKDGETGTKIKVTDKEAEISIKK